MTLRLEPSPEERNGHPDRKETVDSGSPSRHFRGAMKPFRRLELVGAAALAMTLLLGVAFAGESDRAAAETTLASVEKDAASLGTADVIADAVKKSRDALERGRRMRAAGDEKHAKLADGLALEWALVAQELARTAQAERHTRDVSAAAADAGSRADRERTLLEQRLAENGRLSAEAARLEADAGARSATKDPPRATGADAPPPPPRDAGAPKPKDGGAR